MSSGTAAPGTRPSCRTACWAVIAVISPGRAGSGTAAASPQARISGCPGTQVAFFSAHGISALLRTRHVATAADVGLTLRAAAPCVTYLLAAAGVRLNLDLPAAEANH